MTTADRLAAKCDELKALLLRKNAAYGDSATDPVRVFSKADPVEQLKVRLDDKISRLSRGTDTESVPEDTLMDLCGYLILLMVAQEPTNDPDPAPRLRATVLTARQDEPKFKVGDWFRIKEDIKDDWEHENEPGSTWRVDEVNPTSRAVDEYGAEPVFSYKFVGRFGATWDIPEYEMEPVF